MKPFIYWGTDMAQQKIGNIQLLIAPINLMWGVAWCAMGIMFIFMLMRNMVFFGVPIEAVVFLLIAYLAFLLYLKLVCEVSVAVSSDEALQLLKQVGFHRKADGSVVLRFMGIPSDKVRILKDGTTCRLRGSRQLLNKAVRRLKRVM